MTTKNGKRSRAHVEVIAATREEESVLANLLELYAHDFSEFRELELGADGRFGYKHLSLYWREEGRHPFLVRMDGRLAGFALVKRGSEVSADETAWDLAEFFIMRAYRRRGVGTGVAHKVWRLLPGRWEVRVMESNRAACEFWESAISGFTGKRIRSTRFEKTGGAWRIFAFEAGKL